MPSILALLLCTVFVFFLLSRDREQAHAVSRASWIPTVWMVLVAIKPLGRWFYEAQDGDADGSVLDRTVLIGILWLGLLVLATRKLSSPRVTKGNAWLMLLVRVTKGNAWLMLLIGYAFISIAWSDTEYVSLKRWTREELLPVVMAVVVLTERDARLAVQAVLRRTIYITVPFSLLLVKYFPAYGVEYGRWNGELMWVGVATQKNGLGRLCLVAIFFLVWTLLRRWRGREVSGGKYQAHAEVLLIVIAIWLLWGGGVSTYSASAVAGLAAGLAMLFSLVTLKNAALRRMAWTWVVVMALVFIYGAILPFATAGGSVGNVFAEILGRNQTLTGRTDLWAILLPYFERKPVLGYGFGSFWTPETSELASGVNEAHNGYLAVCLELGIIGLALTAIFLLSVARKAQRALFHDPDWGILCLCFVLMIVVHNVSESSIQSLQRQLTATLLLLSFAVQLNFRQEGDYRRRYAKPPGKHSRIGRKADVHSNLVRKGTRGRG